MNHQVSPSRGGRLAAYSALAGSVIPVSAASAAFVGETGLNIQASIFDSAYVDFGPGFGEIFRFSVATTTDLARGFTTFFTTSAVVQFNSGNSGGWTGASMINYPRMGNGFENDPARLAIEFPIDAAQSWYGMTSFFGTSHDLAVREVSIYSSRGVGAYSFGDWAFDLRGYLGLRFTKDGGANYNYAWIDVEVGFGDVSRGGAVVSPVITIHGWGLQTTPNVGLPAGAPTPGVGGLALLAMGAGGIRRSRRIA